MQKSMENRGFCECCNSTVYWKPKKQTATVEEQGIHVTFRRLFAVCMACGHEVAVPEFTERNKKMIADKVKLVKQNERKAG